MGIVSTALAYDKLALSTEFLLKFSQYDTLKLHGEKYMKTYQAIIDKSVPKKDQELW
jgi:hypothetical protein